MQSDNKKTKPESQQKTKLRNFTVASKHNDSFDADSQQLLTLWQQEIENLSANTFQSYQAAIDALIEKVLQKFESDPESKNESKRFLQELLLSDPNIEKEIRSLLSINND